MTTTRGLKQAKSMLAVPGARHPESGRCLLRPEGEAFPCRLPGGACMARALRSQRRRLGARRDREKRGQSRSPGSWRVVTYREERTYSEFFQNAKPAPGPRKVLGSGV